VNKGSADHKIQRNTAQKENTGESFIRSLEGLETATTVWKRSVTARASESAATVTVYLFIYLFTYYNNCVECYCS